jgi:hypothetical protein
MSYHPIPRHDLLCLPDGEEPNPSWLCGKLRMVFGEMAEANVPPLQILAQYQHTPTETDYACLVSDEDTDRLTVVGSGLEIVVTNPWAVVDNVQQHYFVEGRLFIKSHGDNFLLPWFFEKFSLWFFTKSKLTPYNSPDDLKIGTNSAIISFSFPVVRVRYGGIWKSRIVS